MVNIEEMAEYYRNMGYSDRNADARVCQDIVLKAISKSNYGMNVTIKGGVVMRSITGDMRRATEDLDLDFIRYSIEDDSIRRFITKLNCLDGITIEIKNDVIEPLSQQEYNGKRVRIIIRDDEGASLLINSCEQIFAEKLRSLLRFGPISSRYKDVFDFCYLKDHVDKNKLAKCIKIYIIDEQSMRENTMDEVRERVSITFNNRNYRRKVETCGDRNWLLMDVDEAFQTIQDFMETISIASAVPNATTLKAIHDGENGEMESFSSIDELMRDLND